MKTALIFTFTEAPVLLIALNFNQTTVIGGVKVDTITAALEGQFDIAAHRLETDDEIGYCIDNDRTFINNLSLLNNRDEFIYDIVDYNGEFPNSKVILSVKNKLEAEKEEAYRRLNDIKPEVANTEPVTVNPAVDPTWINPLTFIHGDVNCEQIILETFQVNVEEGHKFHGVTLATITDGAALGNGKGLLYKMSSSNKDDFNAFILGDLDLPESTITVTEDLKNVTIRYETYVISKEGTLEEFTAKFQSYVKSSKQSLENEHWTNGHWL